MSGSIGLALQQQFDLNGDLLIGGKVYFYQAGTSTPQSAYQDQELAIPFPNPVVLDSDARIPQVYFADGSIRVRMTDSGGVAQFDVDNILVIGPSSGDGGGTSVDTTSVLATGDLKYRYGTGTLAGYVRCNGRSIGSAVSGASERANADAQPLFEHLWNTDPTLSVSGGRGSTANADWVANKTIATPDMRGCVLAALDDMGNSAASRLTSTYFGSSGTTLGVRNGSESRTISQAMLPAVNFPVSGITVQDHHHAMLGSLNGVRGLGGGGSQVGNGGTPIDSEMDLSNVVTDSASLTFSSYGTAASGGSGTPAAIVQPTMLVTFYIKL